MKIWNLMKISLLQLILIHKFHKVCKRWNIKFAKFCFNYCWIKLNFIGTNWSGTILNCPFCNQRKWIITIKFNIRTYIKILNSSKLNFFFGDKAFIDGTRQYKHIKNKRKTQTVLSWKAGKTHKRHMTSVLYEVQQIYLLILSLSFTYFFLLLFNYIYNMKLKKSICLFVFSYSSISSFFPLTSYYIWS
jgi:hypothetical protein